MVEVLEIPPELAGAAERGCWFDAPHALAVLDWLVRQDHRLLGVDSAEKLEDGNWMLLLSPMLDLSYEAVRYDAFRKARMMIEEHPDLMFELVWTAKQS